MRRTGESESDAGRQGWTRPPICVARFQRGRRPWDAAERAPSWRATEDGTARVRRPVPRRRGVWWRAAPARSEREAKREARRRRRRAWESNIGPIIKEERPAGKGKQRRNNAPNNSEGWGRTRWLPGGAIKLLPNLPSRRPTWGGKGKDGGNGKRSCRARTRDKGQEARDKGQGTRNKVQGTRDEGRGTRARDKGQGQGTGTRDSEGEGSLRSGPRQEFDPAQITVHARDERGRGGARLPHAAERTRGHLVPLPGVVGKTS